MSVFSEVAAAIKAEAEKVDGAVSADYKEVLTKAAAYFTDAEAKLTAAVKLVQSKYIVLEPLDADLLSAVEAAYPAVKLVAAVV